MSATLLPNEDLNLDTELDDGVETASDEEISAKYVRGEFRIVTDQGRTQLAEIPSVLESERWELKPDFQRRDRWSQEKQSRLIESFIMNVPIPPVFLYEHEYSRYEVMDGLQRLTAISAFYRDELALSGLEYWKELEGRRYSELPLQLRQGIDRRYLSSIVLLYETAQDETHARRLKQLVFERINSGGVRLTAQESRNALSSGPLNRILPPLARNASFCKAWGIPVPDRAETETGTLTPEVLEDPRYQSMEDVEMVLRFFANRQRKPGTRARRLRQLLDEYWQAANLELDHDVLERVGDIFNRTIDLVWDVLGESAFWVRRERDGERVWVRRPTLFVYDAVMAAFSERLEHAAALRGNSALIQKEIGELYDREASAFDGRRTDNRDVENRQSLIGQMLDNFIDS